MEAVDKKEIKTELYRLLRELYDIRTRAENKEIELADVQPRIKQLWGEIGKVLDEIEGGGSE